MPIVARLVVNQAALKLKRDAVQPLLDALRAAAVARGGAMSAHAALRRLDAPAPDFDARARGADRVRGGAGRQAIDARSRAIVADVRARGDAALLEYTRALRPRRAPRRWRRSRFRAHEMRARARRRCRPRSATRSQTPRRASARYHERQRARSWTYREARRHACWPAGDAARPRRPLRARRQGGVSVVGADERDAGAGRRRGRDRHGRAHARTARAIRWCSRRRISPASTACSRSAARRRSRRSPTARRRFPRSTRSSAPATPTSPRPSAACSARSASTWSPGPRRSWSSPTAAPIPTGSRWTCSRRPSTTSSRRRSCSRPTPRSSTRSRRASQRQLAEMPRRDDHRARRSRDRGALIQVRDLDEACAIANRIAPEHLELAVADPDALLPKIRHAGAIFLGPLTRRRRSATTAPGPNHVLPTARTRALLLAARRLRLPEALERDRRLGAGGAADARADRRRRSRDGEGPAGARASAEYRVKTQVTDERRMRDERAPPSSAPEIRALHALRGRRARRAWSSSTRWRIPYRAAARRCARDRRSGSPRVRVNRYPDGGADAVKRGAARRAAACPTAATSLLGNGSDELHPAASRWRSRAPGAVMLAPEPSFVMYRMNALLCRVRFVGVPLRARLRARRASDARGDRDASGRRWSSSPTRTIRPATCSPATTIERIIARRARPGGRRRGLPRVRRRELPAADRASSRTCW